MRLVAWRPLAKGGLRGFCTIELPIGLTLYDVPVFIGKSGPWATLPSKPMLDRDGQQRVSADGKRQYSPVVEWTDRDTANRFSDAVVALIRQAHPDALDDEGGP